MEFSLIQFQTLNISDQELIQEFGNPCEAYNEHKNKIQEWMEENSITPQLRRNELFMQEVGADTLDWEIPICS